MGVVPLEKGEVGDDGAERADVISFCAVGRGE